ncbi:unnamed protein product [Eretmochelys imbricata]
MDRFVVNIRKGVDKLNYNECADSSANTSDSSVKNLHEDNAATSSSVCNKLSNDQQKQTLSLSSGQCSSYSKPSNFPSDDPVCDIPKNRLERQSRLSRGPYQPRLSMCPRSKIGNKQRRFQSDWYEKYRWLEYSPSKDAAFCFYCRFVSSNDAANKGHTDPAFIDKGFRNWHRANECFKNHQLSKSHVLNCSSWSSFNEGKPIDVLLDEGKQAYLSKQEERCHNQSVMERLIDIVLCLAKDGRLFRGHNEKADSFEKGLFLNLVNMLQKYDPVMAKHVQQSPRNATYLSNRIQNDLIVALRNVVQQKIVSSINGKMVSIIADDTTDCGHHEQMSTVVRYFDNEKHSPVEHFVSVQRLLTVDAQSIFDQLNDAFGILKIDWL